MARNIAPADVFNMPNGEASLQFVTVGNPGNPADIDTYPGYYFGSAPSNALSATGANDANCGYGSDPTNLLTPVGAFAGSPGPFGTYDMCGDLFHRPIGNFPTTP